MRQLKVTKSITNPEETLTKYLNEISRIDQITPEEEVLLAQRIKLGDTIAVQKLAEANLLFVVSVAKQYQGNGLSLNDLINEGNIGLIKAARKFDETKGFKFISYAVWWIRQSIMEGLSKKVRLVHIPLNLQGHHSKIEKVVSDFIGFNEREPTPEELAEILNLDLNEIEDILAIDPRARPMSLETSIGEEDGSLIDVLADPNSVPADYALINDETNRVLATNALQILSKREAEVVSLYFGINEFSAMTISDIAKYFDLTPERVRQIKENALRSLRAKLSQK